MLWRKPFRHILALSQRFSDFFCEGFIVGVPLRNELVFFRYRTVKHSIKRGNSYFNSLFVDNDLTYPKVSITFACVQTSPISLLHAEKGKGKERKGNRRRLHAGNDNVWWLSFLTCTSLFLGGGFGGEVWREGNHSSWLSRRITDWKNVLLTKKRLCKCCVTENVFCMWSAEAKNFAIKKKVKTKVRKVWTKAILHMSRTCKM